MTDLQLKTEETCVEWVLKWVMFHLQGYTMSELTEDKVYLTTEQVMRDWDLYCGRDYPELPELTDSQWEGCLESVIESVWDKVE